MGNNELQKNIGLLSALSIVVGMIIGGGVFFKAKSVLEATGAPGLGVTAWVLGGVLSVAGALTGAELSAAIPKTGGMIAYLEEVYGDLWAYLLGWAQTIVYFPATSAAIAIMFGVQTVSLFGLNESLVTPIGIGIIIFLCLMNILGGSKAGAFIQNIATVGKLVPLFAIIIVGFIKGNGGTANLFPMVSPDHPVATGLGSALIATLFAYDGWIMVGSIAGEMKNPGKDLPRAIVGGILIVMGVYVGVNVAYLFVLPAHKLVSTATPAAAVAQVIFGANGGKLINIGILVSIFGCLNGYLLTGPRVPFALASENKLPYSEWFTKLSEKSGSPVNSIFFIGILSTIYVLSGKFDQLTDLIVFIMWLFYVMVFVAVFILRKREPDLHRPYKVPLYPIIPGIAILGGLYVIINTLLTQPMNATLGILITALGLPIYMARKSKMTVAQEQ